MQVIEAQGYNLVVMLSFCLIKRYNNSNIKVFAKLRVDNIH